MRPRRALVNSVPLLLFFGYQTYPEDSGVVLWEFHISPASLINILDLF